MDVSPRRTEFSTPLPSRDPGLDFLASFKVEWRIVNPVALVRHNVTDVRVVIQRELEHRAYGVLRQFGLDELAAAEAEINRQLAAADFGSEYGLSTEVVVQLLPPTQEDLAADLQLERRYRHEEQVAAIRETFDADLASLRFHLAEHPEETAAALEILRRASRPDFSQLLSRMLESGLINDKDLSPEARDRLAEAFRHITTKLANVPAEEQRVDKTTPEPAAVTEEEHGPDPAVETKSEEMDPVLRTAPEPTAPLSYDELVAGAFAELVQPGRLLFNPPDRMQLGQTTRVEVRLTRTLTLEDQLRANLRGPGEPQVEKVPTAPLMAVRLIGLGFDVTQYSDEEQRVTPDQITTWEFDIQALKRGQQHLVLSVSLRIPVSGQPNERQSIPVREVIIEVQIGAVSVGHFVSTRWPYLVTTAVAIGGVIVVVFFH